MSSYDDLLRLAEENSREANAKVAENKKKVAQKEALLQREKEREQEIALARKRQLAEVANRNRLKEKEKERERERLRLLKEKEKETGLKSTPIPSQVKDFKESLHSFTQKIQINNESRLNSSHNSSSRPTLLSKPQNKPTQVLSFEELMAIASSNDPKNQAKSANSARKSNPFDSPSRKQTTRPNLGTSSEPKINKIPKRSGEEIRKPINNSLRRELPSKINQVKAIQQPSSIKKAIHPAIESNKVPIKPRTGSAILTGSRFEKLGRIDNEMPVLSRDKKVTSLKQTENTMRKKVNPQKTSQPQSSDQNSIQAQMLRKPNPNLVRSQQQSYPISRDLPARPNMVRPIQQRPQPQQLPKPKPKPKPKSNRFDPKDDIIDEEYAKKNISSIIGSLFGYDRSRYVDEESDGEMEVSASRLRAEESRSARIAREEDEREEELERQRLEKIRQRKLEKRRRE